MMKNVWKYLLLIGLAVTILVPAETQEDEYSLEIKTPKEGTSVGKTCTASGLAIIQSGSVVWVLVRRSDFEGVWWPQGSAKVDPSTKRWKRMVTFGESQDIGEDFDIAVIIVAQEEHAKLQDYWNKAMQSNKWLPREMPKTIVAPKFVKVKKVSHE